VSGMVAVNFGSQGSLPDSLVFADSTGSPLFGVARLRLDGSRRIESVVDWPTGQGPGKMVTGDIDGNGVADIVVLCGASNMVQVFMGKPGPVDFEYVDQGVSLLAGAAMDVTLADMDDDGFLDLVLARESGQVVVIFYRQYAGGSMFLGSYQGILGDWPVSLATGHFLAPLPGAGADYLDAALLVEPGAGAAGVAVFASDHMVGMPFRSVGTVGIGVGNAKQILAGNFDVDRNVGLTDPATRPDDLIVATSAIATQANPYTAKAVLFNEVDHSTPAATVKGIKAGDVPAIAVVDDFDLDEGGAHDVAFIWHLVKTLAKDSFWYLQPHLGAMDGTFAAQDPGGVSIDPLQIQDNRNPVKAVSFPMRRTLLDYVNGVAAPPDILVANRGTNDFTVFVGMGDGSFMPKYDGSLDFAAGGIPVDIKAGYLRGSVLETVETDPEAEQLPDVVVLLNGYLMISYSLDAPALQESGEDVGFRAPVAIGMPSAKQPIALELADMDGDGFMDIVVLDQRLSKVFVYMNLAERMFAGPYGYSTGKTPVSMSVADVDADGCLDIVTADRDGRTVTTIHNDTPTCRSGQQRRR